MHSTIAWILISITKFSEMAIDLWGVRCSDRTRWRSIVARENQSDVAIFGIVSATPNHSIGEIDDELKIENFSKWKRFVFLFFFISIRGVGVSECFCLWVCFADTNSAQRISFHVCAVKRVREHYKYYFLHWIGSAGAHKKRNPIRQSNQRIIL